MNKDAKSSNRSPLHLSAVIYPQCYSLRAPHCHPRVADECLKTEHPEMCRHKMSSMPRWISSSKVEIVRSLLSEDPAMILRETLGIAADGSSKAYRLDDVESFLARLPQTIAFNPRNMQSQTQHVFVAVDPSGGGPSAFAITTVVVLPGGQFQARSQFAVSDCTAPTSFELHIACITDIIATNASGLCA